MPCLIILIQEQAQQWSMTRLIEAGLKKRYLSISSFMSGVAEGTRSLGTVLAGFFCPWSIAPDLLYHDCDFYHSSFPDLDAERT